eukprot:scaffold10013_cov79-Skeletonema_dohrnii-CCMP3373.AAC.21
MKEWKDVATMTIDAAVQPSKFVRASLVKWRGGGYMMTMLIFQNKQQTDGSYEIEVGGIPYLNLIGQVT